MPVDMLSVGEGGSNEGALKKAVASTQVYKFGVVLSSIGEGGGKGRIPPRFLTNKRSNLRDWMQHDSSK